MIPPVTRLTSPAPALLGLRLGVLLLLFARQLLCLGHTFHALAHPLASHCAFPAEDGAAEGGGQKDHAHPYA
jgi:hypothetical protein